MWSKGDGGLVKLYPEHAYRDFSPNAAECMLACLLALVMGMLIMFFNVTLAGFVVKAALVFSISSMLANIGHDLLRHLVLHPERIRGMRTTLTGWKWIAAMIEGAVIRVFSEWGRVVGLLERGDYHLLLMRFDWFCGIKGEAPKQEEMRNNHARAVLSLALFLLLRRVV